MAVAALDNPLEDLLGYQLRRASAAAMGQLARDLQALDLTPMEASLLVLVAANRGITQSVLGRTLGIHRANMVPLVATLGRRGLVERSAAGRSHGLAASACGTELAHKARAAMLAHDAAIVAALRPGEAAPLREVLARLRPQVD